MEKAVMSGQLVIDTWEQDDGMGGASASLTKQVLAGLLTVKRSGFVAFPALAMIDFDAGADERKPEFIAHRATVPVKLGDVQ
jgi:hypothetical protein